ncbi:MAG: glycoside hydrolase family 6 protein, partial [Solirubrobacteraceae bacterium]
LRRLGLAFATALVFFMTLGLASAQASDTFRLSSTRYSASEGAGRAVITVTRSSARYAGIVRYIAIHQTADAYADYTPVKDGVEFAQGQYSATFTVPIVDDNAVEQPETVLIGLFGPADYGPSLAMLAHDPEHALLTIVDNDAIATSRDNTNPLQVSPVNGNPLPGARFFIDREWGLAARFVHRYPSLRTIADQPETKRFGGWDPNGGLAVNRFLTRAEAADPGAVPLLAAYRLKHVRCGNHSDSGREQDSYKRWIAGFARGIGNYRAVLFLEQDALITAGCLSSTGLRVRLAELRYAVDKLSRLPHLVTYLDAGASDAVPPARTARLLRLADVRKIQGFFTNSTHFARTRKEIDYGNRISHATGGKHFVVSTAVNGRGPLVPHNRVKYGNSVLCNPSGRGLGPKPTTSTGFPRVDAFIWIGNPGRSGGPCHGSPATGVFWPEYAMGLVQRADFRVR